MKRFEPLSRQRASDSVYDVLRDAILNRVFAPGQRLNMHELASRLGVSMTPVKDALSRLAAEDLIAIRPRIGTFVTTISPEDVAETFEIRAALEGLATEKAQRYLTKADLARLQELAEGMRRTGPNDAGRAERERMNLEFHNLLVSRTGNRRLIQIYLALNAHIRIARIHRSHAAWLERTAAEDAEHRRIVDALMQENGLAAAEAMRAHIRRAADSLVQDLRQQDRRVTAAAVAGGRS